MLRCRRRLNELLSRPNDDELRDNDTSEWRRCESGEPEVTLSSASRMLGLWCDVAVKWDVEWLGERFREGRWLLLSFGRRWDDTLDESELSLMPLSRRMPAMPLG